jgi:hypothetical protein
VPALGDDAPVEDQPDPVRAAQVEVVADHAANPIPALGRLLLIGSINADDANGIPRCPRKNHPVDVPKLRHLQVAVHPVY